MFGRGKVASYIPALAQVAPRQFGMAVALVDGTTHSVGDAQTPFSLQSITKLFAFVLALKMVGDDVWNRVGREPSGAAFNSMVQLETEKGIPRNPFINAGALVITDILTTRYAHLDIALLGALRRLTDDPDLKWNEDTKQHDYGAIDWIEFWATVNGNGPCNKERLGTRVNAHNDGQWVRDAALAYAARQKARAMKEAA